MRRFALVALVLLLTGCSTTSGRDRTAAPEGSPGLKASGTAVASAIPVASEASRKATESADKESTKGTAPPTEGTSGYSSRNNMPLVVTMNKTCLRPGEQMRVVAETSSGAQVGFAAAYSDNSQVPDIFWVRGEANPTGTVTWTFVIKPTTPEGDGWLDVVAAKKPGKGASFEGTFRVDSAC